MKSSQLTQNAAARLLKGINKINLWTVLTTSIFLIRKKPGLTHIQRSWRHHVILVDHSALGGLSYSHYTVITPYSHYIYISALSLSFAPMTLSFLNLQDEKQTQLFAFTVCMVFPPDPTQAFFLLKEGVCSTVAWSRVLFL